MILFLRKVFHFEILRVGFRLLLALLITLSFSFNSYAATHTKYKINANFLYKDLMSYKKSGAFNFPHEEKITIRGLREKLKEKSFRNKLKRLTFIKDSRGKISFYERGKHLLDLHQIDFENQTLKANGALLDIKRIQKYSDIEDFTRKLLKSPQRNSSLWNLLFFERANALEPATLTLIAALATAVAAYAAWRTGSNIKYGTQLKERDREYLARARVICQAKVESLIIEAFHQICESGVNSVDQIKIKPNEELNEDNILPKQPVKASVNADASHTSDFGLLEKKTKEEPKQSDSRTLDITTTTPELITSTYLREYEPILPTSAELNDRSGHKKIDINCGAIYEKVRTQIQEISNFAASNSNAKREIELKLKRATDHEKLAGSEQLLSKLISLPRSECPGNKAMAGKGDKIPQAARGGTSTFKKSSRGRNPASENR